VRRRTKRVNPNLSISLTRHPLIRPPAPRMNRARITIGARPINDTLGARPINGHPRRTAD